MFLPGDSEQPRRRVYLEVAWWLRDASHRANDTAYLRVNNR